jgi:O-antigen ligase
MPEHLRALVVVLVLSTAVFAFVHRPACALIGRKDYTRKRNLWFALTLTAFLSSSFWLYALIAIPLVVYAYSRETNPSALYFFLLFVLPTAGIAIPGMGLINYFFDLSHARILALFILFPALVALLARGAAPPFGRTGPDKILLAYILFTVALYVRATTLTDTARQAFYMFIDVFLPYFVISRSLQDTRAFRVALTSLIVAIMIVALVAVFETARHWAIYQSVVAPLGLAERNVGSFGAYVFRGGMLRATAIAGQPIALGYLMVIGIGLCLYLQRFINHKLTRVLGIALLVAGLIASISRGPWTGAAALVIIFLFTGRNAIPRVTVFMMASIVILSLIALLPGGERLIDLLPFIGETEQETIVGRQSLLEASMTVIGRNPWFGSVNYLQAPELASLRSGLGIIDIVNSYIQVTLDKGLVGLSLFVGFFLLILFGTYRAMRLLRDKRSEEYLLGRALFATLLSILLIIFTVSSITVIPIMYWSVAGMSIAYAQMVRRQMRAQAMIPAAKTPETDAIPPADVRAGKKIVSRLLTSGLIVLVNLTLGLSVSSSARAATAANAQSPLGINLNGVSYYSPEQPFLNIFKTSGAWITHSNTQWNTGEEQYLQLDASGYPTTLTASSADPNSPQVFTSVGVLLNGSLPSTPNGRYPAGQYVVLYDGEGTLTLGFDARLVSSSPGRYVINVATPSAAGIDLRITSTDPNHTGNYLRNIRLVKAENEPALNSGQLFNPTFLSLLQRFRVLRFMDWLRTNGNPLSSWSNRPLLTDATWATNKGVPLEVVVQLANAISADAWVNIPHKADDEYITQMAKLVHRRLGLSQKVYVELSNEVWNGAFPQFQYAANQGQALWPKQPGGGAGFTWNRNWYGMRVAQMCDIWKSVWRADANRVICVLGAQAANAWTATQSLNCPYWTAGAPCSGHGIGAVAIAPYFGRSGVPVAWTSDPDGGLASLFTSLYSQNDPSIPPGGALAQASSWESNYVAALGPYKLPLIAYEGGQHYVSFLKGTAALTNLYIAANRDSRMGVAYTTYLQQWKANGGQLFVFFNDVSTYTQYGEWGALESVMQTTVPLSSAPPNWQAIQSFITDNACWWSGCVGTIPAAPTPMAPSNLVYPHD